MIGSERYGIAETVKSATLAVPPPSTDSDRLTEHYVTVCEPLLNHRWTQIGTDCFWVPATPNRERRVSCLRFHPCRSASIRGSSFRKSFVAALSAKQISASAQNLDAPTMTGGSQNLDPSHRRFNQSNLAPLASWRFFLRRLTVTVTRRSVGRRGGSAWGGRCGR